MSKLLTFFKEPATEFGAFYPRHHLIAVFETIGAARNAEAALRGEGFSAEEMIAVPGEDLMALDEEQELLSGVTGYFMRGLSRLFATEEIFHEKDMARASGGAGFLAVRCEDERAKKSAWEVIRRDNPLAARHYGAGGIEHLAGGPTTN